jgi:hypothetical protein
LVAYYPYNFYPELEGLVIRNYITNEDKETSLYIPIKILNESYPGRSTCEHDDSNVILLRGVGKWCNFGRLRQLGAVVNNVVKGNDLDVLRKAWNP